MAACHAEAKRLQYGRSQYIIIVISMSMRCFSSIISISRLTLGLMLFAQLSLVAHACTLPDSAPDGAFNPTADAVCHHADKFNPNACLTHCTEANQTSGSYEVPAITAATLPVLRLALLEVGATPAVPAQPVPHTEPPQTILYSRFLN
jgi:hypothetical protein